jgi:hypothetical protein
MVTVRCRHCGEPIAFVHTDTGVFSCADDEHEDDVAEPDSVVGEPSRRRAIIADSRTRAAFEASQRGLSDEEWIYVNVNEVDVADPVSGRWGSDG